MNADTVSTRHWYVLVLGATMAAIGYGASSASMPVLFNEISAKLHLDVVQIGVVWGFGSIAAIISIPALGFLADRIGAKRILAVSCLLAGILGALRGLSNDFTSLTVTSLLFGLVSEALPVVVIKNSSQWFYGRRLGTAQGIITTFIGGGVMAGSMFSATALSPWLGGWNNVMYFYGGISFFLGVLCFLTMPEAERNKTPGSTQRPLESLKQVVRGRNVWLIALVMLVFAGNQKGVMGYLPLYLHDKGWSTAGTSGVLAVLSAAGTLVAVPFTLLSDRLGARKSVLLPGLFIMAVGIGLLSVFNGAAVWPLAFLIGLFRDVIWAVAATMIVETEGIGPVYAGTAVGFVHSMTRVGGTFVPPLGNSLSYLGAGTPFIFWAILSLASLVLFLFVRETGSRKTESVK